MSRDKRDHLNTQKELKTSIDQLTTSVANLNNALEKSKSSTNEVADLTSDVARNLAVAAKAQQEINDLKDEESDLYKQQKKYADLIGDSDESRKNILKNIVNAHQDIANELVKQAKLTKKEREELAKQEKLLEEAKNLEARKKELITDQLGIIDKIGGLLGKFPVFGGLLANAFDATNIKAKITQKIFEDMKTNGGGLVGGFKAMGTGVRAIGPLLKAAMAPLLPFLPIILLVGSLAAVVAVANKMNKIYTEIANTSGVTLERASRTTQQLVDQNLTLDEISAHSKALAERFGEYGASIQDGVVDMQKLSFDMQLSEDTALNLLETSQGLNSTVSEMNQSIVNVTKEYYEQMGVQLHLDELTNDVRNTQIAMSKINKTNLALYSKSTDQLVKSVKTMRSLGMEFDQVAKTAEDVLNFESSIEKEMKANVLLGKHINLNMVRYEALFGNAEGVAREMNKVLESQNINLDSFNKMAPFQKKILSETFGMQADEMKVMLLKNKLADKALIQQVESNKISKEDLVVKGKLTEEEADELLFKQNRASFEANLARTQQLVMDKLLVTLDFLEPLVRNMAEEAGLDPESQKKREEEEKEHEEKMKRYEADQYIPAQWAEAARPASRPSKDAGPAEDFIWREGAGVQTFSKGDLVMGIDQSSLSKYSSSPGETRYNATSMDRLLAENNALLSTLIAKVDQPVQFNVNGRAIDEIATQTSMKKSYNLTDNSYGTFSKK